MLYLDCKYENEKQNTKEYMARVLLILEADQTGIKFIVTLFQETSEPPPPS
jgi:hypothetical protein